VFCHVTPTATATYTMSASTKAAATWSRPRIPPGGSAADDLVTKCAFGTIQPLASGADRAPCAALRPGRRGQPVSGRRRYRQARGGRVPGSPPTVIDTALRGVPLINRCNDAGPRLRGDGGTGGRLCCGANQDRYTRSGPNPLSAVHWTVEMHVLGSWKVTEPVKAGPWTRERPVVEVV